MIKPIDPIKVRQARQGRPVLVILTVSLFLAIICGAVLWFGFADRAGTNPETIAPTEAPAPERSISG